MVGYHMTSENIDGRILMTATVTVASRFADLLAYTNSAIAGFNSLKNCQIVLAADVPLFESTFL